MAVYVLAAIVLFFPALLGTPSFSESGYPAP